MDAPTHTGVTDRALIQFFGDDYAGTRQLILRQAGYTVDFCDRSLDRLIEGVRDPSLVAAILSEIDEPDAGQFAEAIHTHSDAAVVLFRTEGFVHSPREFDCVIPPLTPPHVWLRMIGDIIRIGAAARAQSRALRADSAALRVQASLLRSESRAAREETERQKCATAETMERVSKLLREPDE